jgi:outer membrane protein TolC
VKVRQAEAKLAAANYRQAVLEVLADLDSARLSLVGRSRQLAAVVREGAALDRARKQAREQFEAGLIAQIEFLDTERRWLESRRSEAVLRQALLVARVDLIKASGGGRP